VRDFLIPLVLILVVVAGVYVYFQVTAVHGGPVATAPASTETVAPEPPKPAPHPKPVIAKVVEPPAPAPVQVEEKPAAPPPPPRPIPTGTPEQVNPGMDAKRVVELLGEPDLTTLKIDRGNLFETYVYEKKPGQNLASSVSKAAGFCPRNNRGALRPSDRQGSKAAALRLCRWAVRVPLPGAAAAE
jgi:hypothetical protein